MADLWNNPCFSGSPLLRAQRTPPCCCKWREAALLGKKVRHTHPPIEKYAMTCCFIFAIIVLIYSHFLNMLFHLNLSCCNSLSLSCKYFFFSSLDTICTITFTFSDLLFPLSLSQTWSWARQLWARRQEARQGEPIGRRQWPNLASKSSCGIAWRNLSRTSQIWKRDKIIWRMRATCGQKIQFSPQGSK